MIEELEVGKEQADEEHAVAVVPDVRDAAVGVTSVGPMRSPPGPLLAEASIGLTVPVIRGNVMT